MSLERGGVLPEGAHRPRARQSPARGGVQPPSEAESRDVNGYPSPVYPRVKTLLGFGMGDFLPRGYLSG
jgi:hypothetical protein